MPNFKFAAIAGNRAPCAVDFGGGNILHLTYAPDQLTTQFLLDISALESASDISSEEKLRAQVNALVTLITSWDAYEDDGAGGEQPLPIDFEHLAALPLVTLTTIFKAIAEDQAGEASAPTASAKA